METSTPIHSPQRKKHSLVQKFVPIEENLGDIESELLSRRQEAINKSTEARRRLSAAPLLTGYTISQLTQHCKDVIKLSTENKINCKNAFSFWLIDVMAAMAKKKDSEINKNFQVASCTLDASVKIYGYRVDAIHTDALKMAGGIFSKELKADACEDEEKKEGENEKNEEILTKIRGKKRKKKLTVVLPETLNAKSETDILIDAIPPHNHLNRKCDGNDLLIKIPKYNDGGLLLLDSEYPCWPYGANSSLVPKFENKEIFDCAALISLMSEIQIAKEETFCPAYSQFQYGKVSQSGDSDEESQTFDNSGRFEYDMHASMNDVSVDEESEDQRNRINIPAGGFDSDQEIVVKPEKAKRGLSTAISDMKCRISINPSEYSMFDDKIFKAWAGPSHWKVKPVRKPFEEFANKQEMLKPMASKRTRKGKIKCNARLFDALESSLNKNLVECEKTTLFKSTMLNWNPLNTTMPEDLKCKSKNLTSLYHIPSFTISCRLNGEPTAEISNHNNEGKEQQEEEDQEDQEDCIEELEYCSASILQESDHFPRGNEHPNTPNGDKAWHLGNMVEMPNKVQKTQIAVFKRRKHVDIKHLKRGLWNLLVKSKTDESEESQSEKAIDFRQLVKIYPATSSNNFSSFLSAPLIFNALLHLSNEKSLVLTQDRLNKFNFLISH